MSTPYAPAAAEPAPATMTRSAKRGVNLPRDIALVAVFAALIAALALAPGIPLTFGVPITLQTLGVALAGLCLGPVRGFLATALYVVAGLAGLPIFSGGAGGIGVLQTARAGYLIAFPFAALLTGLLAWLVVRRGLSAVTPVLFFCAVAVSRLLIIWPLGAATIARVAKISYAAALKSDMAFWVGDAVKAAIASVLAFAVHKAFPRLLGR